MALMVIYTSLWTVCLVGIGLVLLGRVALFLTRSRAERFAAAPQNTRAG